MVPGASIAYVPFNHIPVPSHAQAIPGRFVIGVPRPAIGSSNSIAYVPATIGTPIAPSAGLVEIIDGGSRSNTYGPASTSAGVVGTASSMVPFALTFQ